MSTTILPQELLLSLQGAPGFDPRAFTDVHESGQQVTAIRVNPRKPADLSAFNISHSVPWSSTGYYLSERPSFTMDPLWHAGAYYVQEASSMFLEQCLKQGTDLSARLTALDLCAAPGGKSTLLQSALSKGSMLVSNEVIKTRVNILAENLTRWGSVNHIITCNDPRDFSRMENFFDVMVIDAPCSGSGLFRRDPSAVEEWSLDSVQRCSERQQRILADAYPALKQNGLLVYSTCSYSTEENEMIADWICSRFNLTSIQIPLDPSWNIVETRSSEKKAFGYRFFPDKLSGEGFYISCFRKLDGESDVSVDIRKKKWLTPSAREAKIVQSWLNQPEDYGLYHLEKEIFLFPAALEQEMNRVGMNLYIKKAGVTAGRIAQDELIPDHDLALSGLLNPETVVIPLNKEQALQYLRKEEVTNITGFRGWAIVQYHGVSLGWIKALGNRVNNYYPKEWRILKSGNH